MSSTDFLLKSLVARLIIVRIFFKGSAPTLIATDPSRLLCLRLLRCVLGECLSVIKKGASGGGIHEDWLTNRRLLQLENRV